MMVWQVCLHQHPMLDSFASHHHEVFHTLCASLTKLKFDREVHYLHVYGSEYDWLAVCSDQAETALE